jgi:hypothetical protein
MVATASIPAVAASVPANVESAEQLQSHANRVLPQVPQSQLQPAPQPIAGASYVPAASASQLLASFSSSTLHEVQPSIGGSAGPSNSCVVPSDSPEAQRILRAAAAAQSGDPSVDPLSNNEFGVPAPGHRDEHGLVVPVTLANAPRDSN